eukprot:CAMPEP_0198490018 /NCGR_PEP_ID=MMETSP1462-20131121/1845_1 /TAXON_ID=1333877 /ORGANISM="Brandtodinium nutriculum, Strain RCC3387" /LENGTH=55 /DNA_ID=CAMNT_0044218545 /DNA_START=28 /DNA_END=193 /DNA_ORIENTATION=+
MPLQPRGLKGTRTPYVSARAARKRQARAPPLSSGGIGLERAIPLHADVIGLRLRE